jgi:phospholipid/cholesterol/gamma-HCH transport system substrate-binding protein
MPSKTINNIKLGIFVISGLVLMIALLYFIGKNGSLFNPSFLLKTHFRNVQGLQQGNNVRYSGIQAGAVKKITVLNDTVIEITMTIDNSFKNVIRKSAMTSISTDGFVGNKIINITPGSILAPTVNENDVLSSKKPLDTDEMLSTLSESNKNIAVLSEDIKKLVHGFATNAAFTQLLNSDEVPGRIRSTLNHLNSASRKIEQSTISLNIFMDSILKGRGPIGSILKDTLIYSDLVQTSENIKKLSSNAIDLTGKIDQIVISISNDIHSGNYQTIMKDTSLANSLKRTLNHVEQGTERFSQDMEALKSNFLFRGYFKKLAKQEALAKQKK